MSGVPDDAAPRPSRPYMPGYEGMFRARSGPIPWTWAEERLKANRNYWLATTRPDGRPHLMPVWGVWFEGAFYFSTGAISRKARNLAVNDNCAVSTESGAEAVIVEGRSELVGDRSVIQRFLPDYEAKYKWKMDVDSGPYFVVRPTIVYGFIELAGEGETNPTRWTFDS